MEQKKFIQVLRKIVKEEVRSVIKEELTEILQEGLKQTVTEIKKPNIKKKHNNFKENKFSDILNETPVLHEKTNYADIMNEDIYMNSQNARNFGVQRTMAPTTPTIMQDPETGKTMKVDNVVAKAMTRDYTALMKAIDKKKNR
jgi:hypothetical protein